MLQAVCNFEDEFGAKVDHEVLSRCIVKARQFASPGENGFLLTAANRTQEFPQENWFPENLN